METKQKRRGGGDVDIRDPIIVIMMIRRRWGSRMRRIGCVDFKVFQFGECGRYISCFVDVIDLIMVIMMTMMVVIKRMRKMCKL